MNTESAQRLKVSLNGSCRPLRPEWVGKKLWITVNGTDYLAPLVLRTGNPRHPAWDVARAWADERMREWQHSNRREGVRWRGRR